MQEFTPGQRWINDAELHLGLGTVLAVEHRTVNIAFLASGETRTYAKQSAPLTRAYFGKGDTIRSHEGINIVVDAVTEENGLLTYIGRDETGNAVELAEELLDNFIQLNKPGERLLTGQIDQDKWFELRYQTLRETNRLAHSELRGLTGGRTSLIAHQLYIAHEIAHRYAPRVLLADEVGLGKTIEAGLILHQQLLTERARRVLIVVPETLLHQWLVEMLRRFNLQFSIFDEERCDSLLEHNPDDNPFHSEQLILCSLKFLHNNPVQVNNAVDGEWDLLIVDEAHHLEWTAENPSKDYKIVEQLTHATKGLLLLTATPEQLGKESHFARLRLLDPNRFPSFEDFIQEEQEYEPVAHAVEKLLNNGELDKNTVTTLSELIEEGNNQELLNAIKLNNAEQEEHKNTRKQLIQHLVDRHGTGRVLFRNTRTTVKGFPERKSHAYPLSAPEPYQKLTRENISEPQYLLSPEQLFQKQNEHNIGNWTAIDPRVNWLIEKIAELKPEKILVILASAQSVLQLAEALRTREGIYASVFHEGLSIIERDRAAANFADTEDGSQILLCSEIGSEGRNFQFAHQLILFDLPINPDLLEQRIGRLDRIGQQRTIQIHIPYLENTAQSTIYRWYHEGLNAFEKCCPAGNAVYTEVKSELLMTLKQGESEAISSLIERTGILHRELNEQLHNGRDRLLEYNSCRPELANALKEQGLREDKNSVLPKYMDAIFDCFGVGSEEHSIGNYILRPGEDMLTAFPRLPDDGMTITYSRDTALTNEDIHFLTWDHPMVTGAMDIVLTSELGNTALIALEYSGVTAGTLLLECVFILETSSSRSLQTERYLPATTIRVVLDENGEDHATKLSHEEIRLKKNFVDKETARQIVKLKADIIGKLTNRSELSAKAQISTLLAEANKEASLVLGAEIARLKSLSKINANIRPEEIDFFENQLHLVTETLDSASLRLDALRVMIAT